MTHGPHFQPRYDFQQLSARRLGIASEQIELLAHDLYRANGCQDGRSQEHWFQAERALIASYLPKPATKRVGVPRDAGGLVLSETDRAAGVAPGYTVNGAAAGAPHGTAAHGSAASGEPRARGRASASASRTARAGAVEEAPRPVKRRTRKS